MTNLKIKNQLKHLSRYDLFRTVFTFTTGLIIGYNTVQYFTQPKEVNRNLASSDFSKITNQHFSKNIFDLKIKNIQVGQTKNDISIVSVTVSAFKAIPAGLTYTWILPDYVTLVEGHSSGALEDFTFNQKKEFTLKIKGYCKDFKSYLSFSVNGNLEQKEVQQDILLSSNPEDSFELISRENEKIHNLENKAVNKPTTKSVTKVE